jgi:hypothetical protein
MTDPDPVAAIQALIGDRGPGIGERGTHSDVTRTSGSPIPDPGSRFS